LKEQPPTEHTKETVIRAKKEERKKGVIRTSPHFPRLKKKTGKVGYQGVL